ncbi:adenylate/guanylate cyclase domain-containing protein [Reyranella sp.]|uniref:adenylate/guanylate cyclase domain-containing protein n=1 Tax=Reyranella sp. TaxID=1929291 RepID=UPI003BABCA8B
MSLSRRGRWELRIVAGVNLVSAPVSAIFGMLTTPADSSVLLSALVGIVTSFLIATPVVLFEIRSSRPGRLRRLRRLPLALYFALKVLVYFVIIISGLVLVRLLFMPWMTHRAFGDGLFEGSLAFAVGMSVVGNLGFEMGRLLGFGTLRNFVTGRYVQPRTERRTFLLIDMKDSTGVAERLGPVRFHELLNTFFRDITDAALECEAEIHKYVGDEAILTWSGDAGLDDGDVLNCPFVARDLIAANREQYRRRFGVEPTFRAALHHGDIVAGEMGDLRREIAFVGDTLNVAARLLDSAKTLGHDVLVSADLLARAGLPPGLRSLPLPTLAVRGRGAPLEIAALERPLAASVP